MWEQHKGAVMAAFKSEEIAGETWIYHVGLLQIWREQAVKLLHGGTTSLSLSKKTNSEKRERRSESAISSLSDRDLKQERSNREAHFLSGTAGRSERSKQSLIDAFGAVSDDRTTRN
jgi:hypothetical protein